MKNYNLGVVYEMADGDQDFVVEMVKTFIEELPLDIKAMEEAVSNENPLLAYQIAHKMKPNLQVFGLDLSHEIKQMEEWAKTKANKGEMQSYADIVSQTVLNACNEMKKDFNL